MAGAFEVPGNTTPAAEMNVWYDAEAARIVVRQRIDQAFIPLDVTNTVPMNKAIFEQVTAAGDTPVAKLMANSGLARRFKQNPDGDFLHLRHAGAGISDRSDVCRRREGDVGRCGYAIGVRATVARSATRSRAAGKVPAESEGRPPLRQRAVLQTLRRSDDASHAGSAAHPATLKPVTDAQSWMITDPDRHGCTRMNITDQIKEKSIQKDPCLSVSFHQRLDRGVTARRARGRSTPQGGNGGGS